jgi:hypothetical protein
MKFILSMLLGQCFALYTRRDVLKMTPLFIVHAEDEKIKICKDCKFFKKDFYTETKFGHCSHFPNQPIDNYSLVDGFKDTSPTSYHYCATARSSERMCGPEGKYFESKNKKWPQ